MAGQRRACVPVPIGKLYLVRGPVAGDVRALPDHSRRGLQGGAFRDPAVRISSGYGGHGELPAAARHDHRVIQRGGWSVSLDLLAPATPADLSFEVETSAKARGRQISAR